MIKIIQGSNLSDLQSKLNAEKNMSKVLAFDGTSAIVEVFEVSETPVSYSEIVSVSPEGAKSVSKTTFDKDGSIKSQEVEETPAPVEAKEEASAEVKEADAV